MRKGQTDDLGGGAFKKRLDRTRNRSIVLAKGGGYWVFAYLFAKKDRDNITATELAGFRDLADLYGGKTDADNDAELKANALVEICDAR